MASEKIGLQLKGKGAGLTIMLLPAIFIMAATFSWFVIMQADQQMRAELLAQVRATSQTVNVEGLRSLTGTEADLKNPQYLQLKERLAALCFANPKYHFAYLLGQRPDGTIFFLVDNVPPNSKDYSPPGQVFDEASATMNAAFSRKIGVIDGPSTDRWGTWVSALVPVHDVVTSFSGLVVQEDAAAAVNRAVDFYKTNGREAFLKEVNDPKGRFRKGSLYVFAYDLNMTMQAHPVKPELVGQNLLDKKDWAGGKFFRREIQSVALSKGDGWVDYQYENPLNKKIEPKTTYLKKVDDLIICAGAYKGTGELLAVMGIDIDAQAWKWEIAARTALPISLMLLMFIGIATAFASVRQTGASTKSLVNRLFLPLIALIFVMAGASAYLLWQQHRVQVREHMSLIINTMTRELDIFLSQEADNLRTTVMSIAMDKDVQKDLIDGDAPGLLESWRPVFEALHEQSNVTHLYFFDKARVCLMRVHKPDKCGDRIDRFTARKAEETGKTAWGVEMGPMGVLTLRVVQPVFSEGLLVGYVELGKEIELILGMLNARSSDQLVVTIRKEHLDRRGWEEGMRMLNRVPDWDGLSANVRLYASDERLAEFHASLLETLSADDVHHGSHREVDFDGKSFRLAGIPFNDASGVEVGDIFLFHNISDEKRELGRVLTLSLTGSLVFLGLILGFVYVLLRRTDASIKARQAELQASKARFDQIAELSREVIWEVDDKGLYTYLSHVAADVYGYISRELVGKKYFYELHPEEGREEFRQKVLEAFDRRELINGLVNPIRKKDGEIIWVSTNAVPLMGSSGEFLGYRGADNDITLRRMEEETQRFHAQEIERERKNLNTIFDSAQVGLLLINDKREVVRINHVLAGMFGREKQDLIGIKAGDVLCFGNTIELGQKCGNMPFCQECTIKPTFLRVLEEGVVLEGIEVRREVSIDGVLRELWFSINASPLDIDGVRHVLVSIVDMTNSKSLEKSLVKAKEVAEAATRAKSQFLANMSHEIRTPMNAILGFSSLLTNTTLNEKQARHLHTIQSSGQLLLEIVNNILDISKFEAGNLRLESIDFDMDYLCHDVLRICSSKIEGKAIETYVRIDHGVPANLKGDPTRLRQVLVNLLGNAIKFTEHGSVGIKVFVDEGAQPQGAIGLRIHVTDTGIGIPKDKVDVIFEAFTQADESTTRKFGGTGLGLSICKAIVNVYGGRIWVESEVGKGSEFIFTLKLALGEKGRIPGIEPLALEELAGKKVFVVDDHQLNRDLLQYYCEGAGMIIVGNHDRPAEALKAFAGLCAAGQAPDIILSDLMMPDMSGHELIGRIKEIQNIKAVVITSDARVGTAQEAQDFGFDGYISKPFIRSQFYKVLAVVLGDRRQEGPIVTRHMAEEVAPKGVRVLVAEDNMANRMLMEEYLRMLFCEFEFAVNGQEAVEKIGKNTYDLCLMDVQMPVMGGFEATEIIRRDISKDLPIIALSAAVMEEDRARGAVVGMNEYLTKPISLEKLRTCIEKYGRHAA